MNIATISVDQKICINPLGDDNLVKEGKAFCMQDDLEQKNNLLSIAACVTGHACLVLAIGLKSPQINHALMLITS